MLHYLHRSYKLATFSSKNRTKVGIDVFSLWKGKVSHIFSSSDWSPLIVADRLSSHIQKCIFFSLLLQFNLVYEPFPRLILHGCVNHFSWCEGIFSKKEKKNTVNKRSSVRHPAPFTTFTAFASTE